MAGLGGTEGADTDRNCCWFWLQPRITSAKVLMVSVRTSAGMPLANRMVVRRPRTPLELMEVWHEAVTWTEIFEQFERKYLNSLKENI